MKSISTLFLALSLVLSIPAAAPAAENPNDLFQQALTKERTEGNLPEAIKLYQRIVDKYAANRKVAAEALLQLAGCQSKLGDAQARKSLERLVRDFGDQKETVAEASRRLGELGGGVAARQQAMRVVWTGPKVSGESSLSPDGRFFSFPDWESGNLGLHEIATGADRLLTNTGTWKGESAYAEVSAFSKDGKHVAYAWYEGKIDRYELWVLNLDGNATPRRVFGNTSVDYIEPHDWSADGKWIAVFLSSKRTEQIGLIAVQDGSLRVLRSGTDSLRLGGFSSDGRYLVYTRGRASASRCYILSADAKSEVPLLPGTSSVESPVWTPDGSRIVFVSDLSGSPGLWSIRVADGKPLGEPELLKADFNHANAMHFARDGSLFYEARLNGTDIYLAGLDPATGKLTSEPKRINQRATNSWGRIAWLPDGKSLSFWNRVPIGSLVEHTLSTGEEREIWGGKSGRTSHGYNGWFPDGRTLMAREPKGETLVFSRVDGRTGEAEKSWIVPALPQDARDPIYSPDLMTIFFLRKDETVPCEGARCTYVMLARDLQTGRDREVFRTIASSYPGRYAVSPDGRDLASIRVFPEGIAVMVAPAAGGPPREIYRGAEDVSFSGISWARDGGHILAFRRVPAGGEVWSFPTRGGSPEKSALRVQPSEQPAVSPDGTQVAFVGGHKDSEIWIMTGLFPDAKPARAH